MDILQVTEELESLVQTGVRVPGFRKKVLVDIDQLVMLGDELRRAVPANIQEAQEILRQKESIVNQAYLEAQRIRDDAAREVHEIRTVAQEEHHLKGRRHRDRQGRGGKGAADQGRGDDGECAHSAGHPAAGLRNSVGVRVAGREPA